MPKAKRKNGLFDFLKPRSTVYHVKRKRGPTETSSTRYKGHTIYRRGTEGYSVPSIDRESTFDDKRQAKRFIDAMKKYNPKRKRNLEIGLPKNQWANAKVRMKDGKIQVMADERILGKAGFKAGVGLSGVSASGGAKLNPKRKRKAKKKNPHTGKYDAARLEKIAAIKAARRSAHRMARFR